MDVEAQSEAATPDRERVIRIEQLEALCGFAPGAFVLGLLAAVVITALYSFLNGFLLPLLAWVGIIALASTLRLALARIFARRGPDFPVERWALAFVVAAGLGGLAWSLPASGGIDGISAVARPALASVAGAIAAVGGYSLFPYFPAYAVFALAGTLPVIVGCLRAGDLGLEQVGIALALFLLLLLAAGRRLSAAHRELIVARLALEVTERRAQEASRAKSRFLANMSHELRTPLNGVIGMADLLQRTPLDERQRRQATTIARSGRTLLAILTDILDIAKIEAGKLAIASRDFDLGTAVEEVDSLFRPRAIEKGLDFRVSWERSVARPVRGDHVRFVQILGNLVANAVKFTEHGHVEVRISLTADQPQDAALQRVRCEVLDTGIGLSAEQRQRVFDSFEQADDGVSRRYGGTGLGLAIARQLVLAQGGTIGVDGGAGAPTRFWFELPLPRSTSVDAGPAAPAAPTTAVRFPPGTVALVVDDNPANRQVIIAMLETVGIGVELAQDGAEALRLAAGRRCDLVLMDCEMPRMDGFEATRRLRDLERADGSASRLPIIAVTAHAIDGYRERCLAAGMDDYVTKPLTIESLTSAIGRHLSMAAVAMPRASTVL